MASGSDEQQSPTGESLAAPSENTTFPAHEVGLSLTISDDVIKEFERLQAETIRTAEEEREFSWR